MRQSIDIPIERTEAGATPISHEFTFNEDEVIAGFFRGDNFRSRLPEIKEGYWKLFKYSEDLNQPVFWANVVGQATLKQAGIEHERS